MIDAYKGFTGSYTPLKDGDEKHTADYKILTSEEYEKLTDTIASLKRKLKVEEQAHADDVASEQRKAQNTCDRYKQQANEKIAEWKQYAETCKEKQEQAESLNVNLKRICKENANAKRGLKPKKEHSGYVAMKSEQGVRVTYDKKKREETPVWKTTIQTPYAIQLTEKQAREQIAEDIHDKDVMIFKGTYYTNWKMVKDMKAGFWNIVLETREEFKGIAIA